MTWLDDAFTTKTPTVDAPRATPTTGEGTPYGLAALAGECGKIVAVRVGDGRNDQLNRSAVKIAGLVAAGELDEATARAALADADGGAGFPATDRTIESAFRKGLTAPRIKPAPPDIDKGVREWISSAGSPSQRSSSPSSGSTSTTTTATTSRPVRRTRVTWASTIKPERVVWAWEDDGLGRIAAGTLSLSAGREGTGKSSFGVWLASQISVGALPGMFLGTPRAVLYMAVEDSWKHTLVPRLMAAGADLDKIGRLDVITDTASDLTLSLPDDFTELEAAIREHQVACIILDPLMSVMGATIDTHRNREVREALDPLAQLAEKTGALIHGIAHFNKSGGTDAASLISGSGAFKDVPRAVFGFARDDGGGRVFTQVKNSLGRDDLPSLAYHIEECHVEVSNGTTSVGRLAWDGESNQTVADVLSATGGTADDKTNRTEAVEWLCDYLVGEGGEAAADDAKKAARAAGVGDRALTQARQSLGVKPTKSGFQGRWLWRLPVK